MSTDTNRTPADLLRTALGAIEPSDALAAIEQLRHRIEEAEHEAVFTMRHRGESWQAIADATGMKSRQAAQHRYEKSAGLIDRLDVALNRQERP